MIHEDTLYNLKLGGGVDKMDPPTADVVRDAMHENDKDCIIRRIDRSANRVRFEVIKMADRQVEEMLEVTYVWSAQFGEWEGEID